MPVQIDIIDFKCFNQLRNGVNLDQNLSEFTPNLVGNVGEKIRVEYTANIQQSAFTESVEVWTIFNDPSIRRIERSSGSFLADSVQVGDVFSFYIDWVNRRTTGVAFEGTVDFISSDGRELVYTILVGANPLNGEVTNVGLAFNLSNPAPAFAEVNLNSALFLKFGLLENEETFNFISKTTESQQVYYVGELVRNDPAKDMESLGSIKDWVTGSATTEFTNGQPDFLGAEYIISHEFILNPFYILSYRQFIDSNTVPDFFAGDSSLKYSAELEFRKTLSDTGSSKIQSLSGLSGFVGWFGENFNGLNKKYAVASVTYEQDISGDPLDGININVPTLVTITIDNPNAAITDYSCAAYLVRVPNSESDYIGTTTDLVDNFLYKSEIITSPATSTPNLNTFLSGGDLVMEYTVEFTTDERLRLTTEDEFFLFVQIEDPTISAGNSDRVMLIAALQNYVDVNFVEGFVEVDKYEYLLHPQSLGDPGSFPGELSNEDGILLDAVIGTDTTRDVVINGITANLLAYDGTNSFNLDNYVFNVGDPVIVSGIQQLSISNTRGYPLPAGDEFNLAQISTGTLVGDFQQYSIQLGQKIKWQDWQLNLGVDNAFFDANEPNNNLNNKSSNYSNEQGYQIRLALTLNVTGLDDLNRTVSGDFITYGSVLGVNDYDESVDGVTGVIETFDPDTMTSLGSDILYNGKDTLFRTVYQNATNMGYALHRIEIGQNPGDGIIELSSIKPFEPNALLKPLTGETQLTFDLVGSELTTECVIDGGLIQEGVNYKLSARTSAAPVELTDPFTFTMQTFAPLGESANDQFQLPLLAAGTYDFIVDKGNGDPLIEITAFNDPAALLDYSSTGPGVYEVKIYGKIEGWSFQLFPGFDDAKKITEVSQWGTFQPNGGNVFTGCSAMDIVATDTLDLSQTSTLRAFFSGCSSLIFNSSIDTWDVSGITDMNSFLFGASTFNQGMNSWNTGSVTDMRDCFFNASSFNSDITSWDTSMVTTMTSMFRGASAFNQAIGGWTLTACLSTNQMFLSTSSFNQALNSWDVSGVTTFAQMFQNADAFNQPLDLWNTGAVLTMEEMFINADLFNGDITTWDTSMVVTFEGMFQNADAFNQDISGWDTGAATTFERMFRDNGGVFDQDLGSWDVTALLDASNMFLNSSLSTANYDALLVGWEGQAVQNNVTLHGGSSNYTGAGAGGTARAALIADHSWAISDGGPV